MIRPVDSIAPWRELIASLCRDPDFSDPTFETPEELERDLRRAAGRPDRRTLGVWRDGAPVGLFLFLILPEERYVEMLAGLSRSVGAYDEIAAWLRGHCPGYQADFIFNPGNRPLRAMLTAAGAAFDTEQQKMRLSQPVPPVDTAGIEPLRDAYLPQYLAMHSTDVYWNGERVAAAPERFRVLLAVDRCTVAGYVDVTTHCEENEPVDLRVLPAYRRQGWGRKLLARAVELNRPKGMSLLVDVDNEAAKRLYASMGFTPVPGRNSVTASWRIEGSKEGCFHADP